MEQRRAAVAPGFGIFVDLHGGDRGLHDLLGELAGEAGLDHLRDREAAAAAATCTAGAATQEHCDAVADDTHIHLDERRRCRGELEVRPLAGP